MMSEPEGFEKWWNNGWFSYSEKDDCRRAYCAGLLKAAEIVKAQEETRLLIGDQDTGIYGTLEKAIRKAAGEQK